MKKILLAISFNLIFITSYSQLFTNGKIVLTDDTVLKGLVKITNGDDVKFKNDENSKSILYKKDVVKSIEREELGKKTNYIFSKTIKNSDLTPTSYNKLLKVLITGAVNLYEYQTVSYNGGMHTSYYIKKTENEIPLFFVSYGYLYKQNFIEFVEAYFKDCEKLIELVKNKSIKEEKCEEAVIFYNKNCFDK